MGRQGRGLRLAVQRARHLHRCEGIVWLAGNGENDGQILKFTRDGKFVMQIGKSGPQTDSKDTTRLGRPANMTVDIAANEVYVADGYYNHRIIVFDSETGRVQADVGRLRQAADGRAHGRL
jgi:DNA-binding beta-propeller fold protein YncE